MKHILSGIIGFFLAVLLSGLMGRHSVTLDTALFFIWIHLLVSNPKDRWPRFGLAGTVMGLELIGEHHFGLVLLFGGLLYTFYLMLTKYLHGVSPNAHYLILTGLVAITLPVILTRSYDAWLWLLPSLALCWLVAVASHYYIAGRLKSSFSYELL